MRAQKSFAFFSDGMWKWYLTEEPEEKQEVYFFEDHPEDEMAACHDEWDCEHLSDMIIEKVIKVDSSGEEVCFPLEPPLTNKATLPHPLARLYTS